ncbi:CHASE2 domain-containing protein [Endothiovibrio diazotrophicus]
MFRRHIVRIGLSLLVTLLVIAADIFYQLPILQRLEHIAYDTRLKLTLPGGVDKRVVIADIDERSLAVEGRWPWPRNRLARLLDQLFDHYGIAVLGFDVVFGDEDTGTALGVLDQLAGGPLKDDPQFIDQFQRIRPSLEYERLFAEAIKDRPVVMGYYFQTRIRPQDATTGGKLPESLLTLDGSGLERIPFVQAQGYGANLGILQEAAITAGFFDNPLVDDDGVYRRVPLLTQYHGQLYQSLALAVTRLYTGNEIVEPLVYFDDTGTRAEGLEGVRLDNLTIPLDYRAAALVPYRGGQGSFPYVSLTDILDGTADPKVLEGAIVLLGASAPGLQDLRSTPVQNVYSGVEVHANLVAGMLDGSIKSQPGYVLGVEFVLMLGIGLAMTLLLPVLSAAWSTLFSLFLAAGAIAINLVAWNANVVIPLAPTLLLVLLLFLLQMSYGFFVEGRGKRQLTRMFGQYVPPELVDEMSLNPDELGVGGESREMTVLFSDVRSFTTISEGLKPQELTQLMNEMLTPMTRIIHQHRGTIDKYMGDAIMAFWGAPLQDPEHARNALKAGLAMLAELPQIQRDFEAKGWPPIRIGVGLNTGMMNVGNMGSEFRMAYTVLGDAVNLGSRLEGLTKQYGISIMVSEYTKAAVPNFAYRELDIVRVKGKDEPVAIFEPIGPADELSPEEAKNLKLYEETLKLFRAQHWDQAEMQLINLKQAEPARKLYDVYLERIQHYRESPPGADWDGVFTHTTK